MKGNYPETKEEWYAIFRKQLVEGGTKEEDVDGVVDDLTKDMSKCPNCNTPIIIEVSGHCQTCFHYNDFS